MESRNEKEGAVSGGLTRKQFLQTGAMVGLGAGLVGTGLMGAGCGGGGTTPTGSPSPTGAGKAGGIMQIATTQLFPKDSLDPAKVINDGQAMLVNMLREGLVTYGWDWQIIPRLAQSWDVSPDVTEYTFHLRPNVKWHDGKPFVAEDVAWSIDMMLDPDRGSPSLARLSLSLDRDGVEVVDSQTVKLKLKAPDSLILYTLAANWSGITQAGTTDFETGVGTGPFKLKSWEPGVSFETEKNPSYWNPGEPLLDGVRAVLIKEASTIIQSVAAGQSAVANIDAASLPAVQANAALQLAAAKGVQFLSAVMDMRVKPFTDNRVREAMKRSLDREKVLQIGFADQAVVAMDAPASEIDFYFTPDLQPRIEMDRAAAKTLMTEAGYPDGIDLTFKVLSDPAYTPFALGFAAGLEGSPFRITVKQEPAATYWDRVWMKDSFYMSEWNRRHPIESMMLMVQSKAPQNETFWKDPEMDRLLAKALTVQGDELKQATSEALMHMSKNCGMIIPAYRHRLYISKVGSRVVTWPEGLLDFRQMALG